MTRQVSAGKAKGCTGNRRRLRQTMVPMGHGRFAACGTANACPKQLAQIYCKGSQAVHSLWGTYQPCLQKGLRKPSWPLAQQAGGGSGGALQPCPSTAPSALHPLPAAGPEPRSGARGAFSLASVRRGLCCGQSPPDDSTAAAPGQLEESQGIPDCAPVSGTAEGLRGQAGCCWLAASSSLGHLGPG